MIAIPRVYPDLHTYTLLTSKYLTGRESGITQIPVSPVILILQNQHKISMIHFAVDRF